MYKQETDIEQYARNINQYKWLIVFFFIGLSIGLTVIGYNTPKKYLSTATLLVEKEKLISQQVGTDISKNEKTIMDKAEGIVFSRKVLISLATKLGIIDGSLVDSTQEESALNVVKSQVVFSIKGDSYIELGYKDLIPEKAKEGAEYISDLFIEESIGGKARDSTNAYDFINTQVQEYHRKLIEAEDKLQAFNTRKLEQGVTSKDAVDSRIQLLQTTFDDAALQLKEAQIRRSNLATQLRGEVQVTINASRQSEYDARIRILKEKLADLRLNYHDDYPDIVRVREQISEAKQQKAAERRRSQAMLSTGSIDDTVRVNPVYQDMKLRMSAEDTRIATLRTRVTELKKTLIEERQKSEAVSSVDNELAELNRDYDVNETFYKDLLKRREKARIARDIEVNKIYSGVKLYEKAYLPVVPDGLRFFHYIAAGLGTGLLFPLGLIFLMQFFNQNVKSKDMLQDMGIPVLAQMEKIKTVADSRIESIDTMFRIVLIGGMFALIGALVFLRMTAGGGV